MIDPHELVERYGLDQMRYFLLREVPFGNDGDFTHAAMVRRMNSDLANDFGNLAQRVLSMIAKNCGGRVPEPGRSLPRTTRCSRRRTGCCRRLRAAHGRAGASIGRWS